MNKEIIVRFWTGAKLRLYPVMVFCVIGAGVSEVDAVDPASSLTGSFFSDLACGNGVFVCSGRLSDSDFRVLLEWAVSGNGCYRGETSCTCSRS